jgi:cystathionine beta-lyase/cystathionine gamma-synthase
VEAIMKIESRLVHSGDRKKSGAGYVPVSTPIYTAASYFYDSMDQLDRIFAREEQGPSYARYDNPTTGALEELVANLESGAGALACSSGMAATHLAIFSALVDGRRRVVAASGMYGATTNMLLNVFGPIGVETTFADVCDPAAFEAAVKEHQPGAIVMETVSNPLLRVAAMDRIARIAHDAQAPLIVDNTFATPVLVRPLELGANIVVHSATKYMSGHGDVLGGIIVADADHLPCIKTLARTMGPNLGPFESYLVMRGIKTMGLRVERQCGNACKVASWLASHPRVARVHFTGDPAHPDRETILRLFPKNLYGAMIAFELKDAAKPEIFEFMERLKMIVRATSLGDVHTMMLYPAMASHRDLSPKQRERLGIGDNLVRLSTGIEAPEDIIADLEQALA